MLTSSGRLQFLALPGGRSPSAFVGDRNNSTVQRRVGGTVPLSRCVFTCLDRHCSLALMRNGTGLVSRMHSLAVTLPGNDDFHCLLGGSVCRGLNNGHDRGGRTESTLLSFSNSVAVDRRLRLYFLFRPHTLLRSPVRSV